MTNRYSLVFRSYRRIRQRETCHVPQWKLNVLKHKSRAGMMTVIFFVSYSPDVFLCTRKHFLRWGGGGGLLWWVTRQRSRDQTQRNREKTFSFQTNRMAGSQGRACSLTARFLSNPFGATNQWKNVTSCCPKMRAREEICLAYTTLTTPRHSEKQFTRKRTLNELKLGIEVTE